jgi:hypothetical protein
MGNPISRTKEWGSSSFGGQVNPRIQKHYDDRQVIGMADAAVTLTMQTANPVGTLITANCLEVDPASAGAGENLLLPPENLLTKGLTLWIFNASGSGGEDIFVQDDAGAAIATIPALGVGVFYCDGTTWYTVLTSSGEILDGGYTTPVTFFIQATTLTGDVDITVPFKIKVIDAWAISELAGAGDTVQIKETANVITDALDMSTLDALSRATSIDSTFATIAAGGTLRVTGASGTTAAVYVTAVRVP